MRVCVGHRQAWMQTELDGTRAQVCVHRRSIHIHPYINSGMRTQARARARIGGAAAHNDGPCVGNRPRAVRHGARRAGSGAYRDQRRHGGGVPRAYVRVESRRQKERLRAETATLRGGRKCSHALARMRARPRTHTSARMHARLGAYVGHVRHGGMRVRRSAYRAGRVCKECIQIPTHRCVSVHGNEEMKPHSHTRSAAPYHQPAHTGTLVCMGEAPTYTPAHA
jgi:hypothetical protein